MTRKDQIQELLTEAESEIVKLESHYKMCKADEGEVVYSRVKIKNTIENLRSALDYCSEDVSEFLQSGGKKVYFPYGNKEISFNSGFNSSFPGVKKNNENIYNKFKSVQGFESGSYWAYELLSISNKMKHSNLGEYARVDSQDKIVDIGNGSIVIRGGGNNRFSNVQVDDKYFGVNKTAVINHGMNIGDIINEADSDIVITKESEWVEFRVGDNQVDILELLSESVEKIRLFVDDIYQTFGK